MYMCVGAAVCAYSAGFETRRKGELRGASPPPLPQLPSGVSIDIPAAGVSGFWRDPTTTRRSAPPQLLGGRGPLGLPGVPNGPKIGLLWPTQASEISSRRVDTDAVVGVCDSDVDAVFGAYETDPLATMNYHSTRRLCTDERKKLRMLETICVLLYLSRKPR
jgi:hypothetical protein